MRPLNFKRLCPLFAKGLSSYPDYRAVLTDMSLVQDLTLCAYRKQIFLFSTT